MTSVKNPHLNISSVLFTVEKPMLVLIVESDQMFHPSLLWLLSFNNEFFGKKKKLFCIFFTSML